jgi:hypothetical protein
MMVAQKISIHGVVANFVRSAYHMYDRTHENILLPGAFYHVRFLDSHRMIAMLFFGFFLRNSYRLHP